MNAIVLTYDKYRVFSDHMISCYQELWPENPFTFRVPYQDPKIQLEYEQKYKGKVKLIKSSKDIVRTVENLLIDLQDDDWIYWCMDDRYPISLQTDEIEKIYKWVETIDDLNISAIMYLNSRKGQKPENLHYTKDAIYDCYKNKYRRRKNYTMIWMHQFMRVKVIRKLFSHFPENLKSAKEMDYIMFKLLLPDSQKLFVLNKNLGVFGESTSRGEITQNCFQSLMSKNIRIPENFKISGKNIVIGRSTSFFNNLAFWLKILIKAVIRK